MLVLVVDDSPLVRTYVARTLAMTGMEITVAEAANGCEALRAASALLPDLIITDLNMPEMGGDELTRRLRQEPLLASIPVIVLSSDRSAARPAELRRSGAQAYLSKPVSPETLRSQLLLLTGAAA